mmetsp:Transcript_9110/g.24602  ORF Transcript_9110/g.24602 Transcript_9110/m.24602 type:complete len:81 (-) Transcript_9110:896-1138(-)
MLTVVLCSARNVFHGTCNYVCIACTLLVCKHHFALMHSLLPPQWRQEQQHISIDVVDHCLPMYGYADMGHTHTVVLIYSN